MSAFRSNVVIVDSTERFAFGCTLNPDGSILAITGASLRYVTAAPTQVDNGGSLALRSNGALYATAGGGVWFLVGGGAFGWNLPNDVVGSWGTTSPLQVESVYVSASNRWDLRGVAISQATAQAGVAMRIATGADTITGAVVGAASGLIEIFTGATDSTNAGGTAAASGALSLSTGNSTSTLGVSGSTGTITIQTGNSDDANSGDINVTTGTAAATRGQVQFSALRVLALDNVPFAVGTISTDRFEFLYSSGSNLGIIRGASINAVAASGPSRGLLISTGTRTTTDANPGAGSGTLGIATGQTVQSGAAAGAASGALSITTGATTQQTAFAGAASGALSLASGPTDITAVSTGGNSGNVTVGTGATDVSAAVAATGGNSGTLTLQTGAASSTGATAVSGDSGPINMNTGGSADGSTGAITITSGTSSSTVPGKLSGSVAIRTGDVAVANTTGTITIQTGNAAGAGTSGNIVLQTGTTAGGTVGVLDINIAGIDTVTQATTWLVIPGNASALRLGATSGMLILDTSTTNGVVQFGDAPSTGNPQTGVTFASIGAISTNGVDFGSRLVLVEQWTKRPLLIGDIATTQANPDWEAIGTNATSALSTFATGGGVTLTTAGAADDQQAAKPATTAGQTAWAGVSWAPSGAPQMKVNVRTAPAGTVASMRCAVGFKLSIAAGAGMIQNATDADQAFFGYSTDGQYTASSTNWVAVIRIAGVSANVDTGVAVTAATGYRLVIDVTSGGIARFWINGNLVATSAALTAGAAFIPFAAVQTLVAAAAAKSMTVQRTACSRNLP